MLQFNNPLGTATFLCLVYSIYSIPTGRTPNVCTTRECRISSNILKSSMDTKINPCDNFYQYACGNFPSYKKNMYKTDEPYDWFDEARQNLNTNIRNFLKAKIEPGEQINVKNVKRFYQSCINTDGMNKRGLEPIKDVLKLVNLSTDTDFGNRVYPHPSFDWIISAAKLKRNLDIDFLISADVISSPFEDGANYLLLGCPKNCVPFLSKRFSLEEHKLDNVFESEALESFVIGTSLSLMMNHTNRSHNLRRRIEFFSFKNFSAERENICTNSHWRLVLEVIFDKRPHLKLMTVKDLQNFTDHKALLMGGRTEINWKKYVKTIFEGIEEVTFDFENGLILVDENYIEEVIELLWKTRPRTLELAMWFDAVTAVLPYTTNEMKYLDSEFRRKVFNLSEKSWSDNVCPKITAEYMGLAILHHMVDDAEIENHKHQVMEMVTYLKNALEILVNGSTWMDDVSRASAVEKIKEMKTRISHSPWLKNSTLLEMYYGNVAIGADFVQNIISLKQARVFRKLRMLIRENSSEIDDDLLGEPLTVNAQYQPKRNLMTVPMGIMQRPFYGHPLQVLNYGALGSVIGHEIIHGLDTLGGQYNKDGDKVNWWTRITLLRFKIRTHCFINSYNKIKIGNRSCDGVKTVDENIADNAGVRDALMAYHEYVKSHGRESLLVGFESFTHLQLFTLAYANIWCEHTTEQKLEEDFEDPHPPNEARVLGVFKNSKEFSKIWNCPKDSPMNSDSVKCRLW